MFVLGPLLNHNVAAMSAASGGGWTPASLGASLYGWWTADQPSTVNTASTNVWAAYSGSAAAMTQATSANRPTYTSGVKLSFDSTDELDTVSPPTAYDAVAVIVSNASNATWRTLFWASAGIHPFILETGSNRMGIFDPVTAFTDSGFTIAPSTAAIVHVRVDSSGHVFESLNGSALTAQLGDFSGASPADRAANVVGSASGGGQPIGDINAAVISNGVLSSTDLDKTVGSLAWEWGLQGLLPGGHPYKSAAP